MKKILQKIKKNKYYLLVFTIIIIVRFLLSYKLPSFCLINLAYDDKLMISRLINLINGKYFGDYNALTLVKGIIYPLFLYITYTIKISYSSSLSIIYILSCIYFTFSLKKIIKKKWFLIIIFTVLVFNPISYSSDLFQRTYRNSLSMPELLFFLGTIFRIIISKKKNIINYITLGIIISIMLLTKEENIWIIFTLIITYIYTLFHNHKKKDIIISLIPIIEILLCLNIVSYINYRHYGIYTYNELSKSEFKNAYIKLLKIDDGKSIDRVSIKKDTLYKLNNISKKFKLNENNLNMIYDNFADENGEINNGNIVWYLKSFIHISNRFTTGKDAETYYRELSNELDKLFEKGTLKKKFAFPSIFLNTPTKNELKNIPKSLLDCIIYTTTYKEIKVINNSNFNNWKYESNYKLYYFEYIDYHNSANIVKNNPLLYEIIRNIYKYLTIILSIPAFLIYIKNIKKLDKLNILLHITFISYLVIIGGVVYTHVTSFEAIRYCYLGNIYILQNIFISLNIIRLLEEKKGHILRSEVQL